MPASTSISRLVLSDQVKDHLLRAILAGRYPPGDRIVETRVARELGVSQAPVREALRDLEALGLVESNPFRGARVRLPSAVELVEAIAVRAHLEELGVTLAVARLTDGDLDELEACVGQMREAARIGDAYVEAKADAAFHARLVQVAGNAVLVRQWQALEPFSRTYITMLSPGADGYRIADLHQPILDGLKARDRGVAITALGDHYRHTERTLVGHQDLPGSADTSAPPPARARATVMPSTPRIHGTMAEDHEDARPIR